MNFSRYFGQNSQPCDPRVSLAGRGQDLPTFCNVCLFTMLFDNQNHVSLFTSDMQSLLSSKVFIFNLFTFIAIYYALAPFYSTSKQRAWILTAVSSALMTIASAPYVWEYLISGGEITGLRIHRQLSTATCRVFQAYLIAYATYH